MATRPKVDFAYQRVPVYSCSLAFLIGVSKYDNCVCCNGALVEVEAFLKFVTVTSDCRPFPNAANLSFCSVCNLVQRKRTETWIEDCNEIYKTYVTYRQGSEDDQKIYGGAVSGLMSRSQKIVDKFKNVFKVSEHGVWLDYGCGQGHLLRYCRKLFPAMELCGVDQSLNSRQYIEKIKNATFQDRVTALSCKCDVISLIHVLEHFENPIQELVTVRSVLKDDGLILIQIPTFESNPFDLIIYDHGSFFTKDSISGIYKPPGSV